MDAKISPSFWNDPDIEKAPPEVRLSAAWAITNGTTLLCGAFRFSGGRYRVETGLEPAWFERTLEALPSMFVKVGEHVWMPNFILYQFGRGRSLSGAKRINNVVRAIIKSLERLPEEMRAMILDRYPELVDSEALTKPLGSPYQALAEGSDSPYEALTKPLDNQAIPAKTSTSEALGKPLASPWQGPIQSRAEQSRAEQSREGGMGGDMDFIAARKILQHLNERTGFEFRENPGDMHRIARCLQIAGGDTEAVLATINRQCALWSRDPKMRSCLRPMTLFDDEKFSQYFGMRNAPVNLGGLGRPRNHQEARADAEDLRARLSYEQDPEEIGRLRAQLEALENP